MDGLSYSQRTEKVVLSGNKSNLIFIKLGYLKIQMIAQSMPVMNIDIDAQMAPENANSLIYYI